jgi:Histone methylation protein DOT1
MHAHAAANVTKSSRRRVKALENLIRELEQVRSPDEPQGLRRRIEALDHLDAFLSDGQASESFGAALYHQAKTIYAKCESRNYKLYEAIRQDIQRGVGPDSLLRSATRSGRSASEVSVVNGEGYDYLDELISGVLQFQRPSAEVLQLAAEMVSYQPTPARHIFDLIDRAALTQRDLFIDLGSGLGHVPLLVSICTGVHSIGIELEAAYVDCARESAETLNLDNVTFIQGDARESDLSGGTVFYLYTPFTGTVLEAVLNSLREEAARREIRICTFGPCTRTVAEEPWLRSDEAPKMDRIAVFQSLN